MMHPSILNGDEVMEVATLVRALWEKYDGTSEIADLTRIFLVRLEKHAATIRERLASPSVFVSGLNEFEGTTNELYEDAERNARLGTVKTRKGLEVETDLFETCEGRKRSTPEGVDADGKPKKYGRTKQPPPGSGGSPAPVRLSSTLYSVQHQTFFQAHPREN